MIYRFSITPVGKPRMTRADKWLSCKAETIRKPVGQYFRYKDGLLMQTKQNKFILKDFLYIVFFIPMPDSWSKKKKAAMVGTKHQQKPDTDNLMKAFCDALDSDDAHVYRMWGDKYWEDHGAILVFDTLEEFLAVVERSHKKPAS